MAWYKGKDYFISFPEDRDLILSTVKIFGVACVNDVADELEIDINGAKRRLDQLVREGLLESNLIGRVNYYKLI